MTQPLVNSLCFALVFKDLEGLFDPQLLKGDRLEEMPPTGHITKIVTAG